MKYTTFFGQINKDNGLQRISKYQLARIMNIAYLEGRRRGIQEASKKIQKTKNTREALVIDFTISKRLTELTGNKDPRALMEEICYLSEKEI
ncbi:MAG: hypothetical protein HKN90_09015 [Flavobacteriaceae bacterium]|nr:hypothetical protein [Flavobacteriaceae bacterium]